MLALLLRPWLQARRAERDERIRKLEMWHQIHDEWVYKHNADRDYAVEMAKQGLSFVSRILLDYYLPVVREVLNTSSVLL